MLDRKSLVSSSHNFFPNIACLVLPENKMYRILNLVEIICILDSLMVASEHELQGDMKSRFYDYQNNDINVDEGYQNERSFENIGSEVGLDREEKQASCMFSSISNYIFHYCGYNEINFFIT